MKLSEKVIKVIEEVAFWKDGEKITSEMDLYDEVMLDELDIVDLLITLEDVFNMDIPDVVAFEFKTVQDIIDYINEKLEVE